MTPVYLLSRMTNMQWDLDDSGLSRIGATLRLLFPVVKVDIAFNLLCNYYVIPVCLLCIYCVITM